MEQWWKDPRLDDEGTYDYLVEELPKDYARWEISKYRWRCDNCGKESHICFESAHYFYCWDGWDSMHWNECWKCRLKANTHNAKWKIKKKLRTEIKAIKLAKELNKDIHKGFKYNYSLAKKLVKG